MMIAPVCFVDTNLFVRYLTNDDKNKAEAVEKLLLKAKSGKIRLVTSDIVIAELVRILTSFYEQENEVIADLLRGILNTEGLKVDNPDIIEGALEVFEGTNIDFIDAYIISYMRLKKVTILYSYNKKHLSKFSDIKRIEP